METIDYPKYQNICQSNNVSCSAQTIITIFASLSQVTEDLGH